MSSLWSAVTTGALAPGLAAFFPEAAYKQVKAIADPAADYRERLLAEYRLDIDAAHGLLGARSRDARLIEVWVPRAYAHWVPPGTCANRVGYYEIPNSRLVYSENGYTHSFGIASMISWRGMWFVVHLGAVERRRSGGIVDDPSSGSGAATPSSTC